MTITDETQTRQGDITQVTVSTDLVGVVFFHWFLDGAYVRTTQSPSTTFQLTPDEQARIEVIDTNDPDFDPVSDAPEMFPGRYTVWFGRSLSPDVVRYRIDHREDFGGFDPIGFVEHDPDVWSYGFLTTRLTDLAVHAFDVRPIDAAGNVGQSLALTDGMAQFLLTRRPDAPDFSIAFDPGTTRVTFTEVP